LGGRARLEDDDFCYSGFSELSRRSKEDLDLLENPLGDLKGHLCLIFVRFARGIQVAKRDGVIGQIGGLLEERSEGRIKRNTLTAQFVQVVGPPESHVPKCEKGLGSLLNRLLAVEDLAGRLWRCQ
jgi:hypothetical protein